MLLADKSSLEFAEAMLQRAAIVLEQSRDKYPDWDGVRFACDLVRDSVSTSVQEIRAVADLMHAETYFEERQYSTALAEFKQLVASWPLRNREVASAEHYAGICCLRTGDPASAKQFFMDVLERNVRPDEFFAASAFTSGDISVDSAEWLRYIFASDEKANLAGEIDRFISNRKSNSSYSCESLMLQLRSIGADN